MGAPETVDLVELGPGRGTLMADALRAAHGIQGGVQGFVAALSLHLVETSPRLREVQRQALAHGAPEPRWVDHLSAVAEGPRLLLANEFLDALPVHQLVRTDAGWCERRVDLDPSGDGLRFVLSRPTPEAVAMVPAPLQGTPVGGLVEVRPAASALIAAIAGTLVRYGGAALIIDYGPAKSAPGDSLQAVRGHEFADVLGDPGTADITAHVDFQALAAAAQDAGARCWGPIGQGTFLTRLGIGERTAHLAQTAGGSQAAEIESASKRLIEDGEMGTLFKVLAVTGIDQPAPAGFEEV
jgi:NADH dehydrogenase [ubiquinone] 1 alpha subcomplex assembly factor 7